MNEAKRTTQAERVIAAFGGSKALLTALWSVGAPRDRIAIYRWTRPKELGGTGGYIPSRAWDEVLAAADKAGVVLTDAVLSPRMK